MTRRAPFDGREMATAVPRLSTWSVFLYLSVNKSSAFIYNLCLTLGHTDYLCLLCKYCQDNVLLFAAALALLIVLGQTVPPSKIYLEHPQTNPVTSNKASQIS